MRPLLVIAECAVIPLVPWLLAEAEAPGMPWWSNLSSQAVLSGLCAFLVVKAIPAKDEATRQERKQERDDFRQTLVDMSDRFLGELKAGRQQFMDESKSTRDELMSVTTQLLGELKDARDFYAGQVEAERQARKDEIHAVCNKAQAEVAKTLVERGEHAAK